MLIDLSLEITPKLMADAQGNERKALVGHIGTHFDVMDKVFPLDYTERPAIVFDVSSVKGRDISPADFQTEMVEEGMFVAFYTGFLEKEGYGSSLYFQNHPQLSNELIDLLLTKKVAIIAIDCAGIRRGKEHTPIDQYCADQGVFVVENVSNLQKVLNSKSFAPFSAKTYPLRYTDVTGLPCRVVAKI